MSLGFLELVLRIYTHHPVSFSSNKVIHDRLGYVMDTNLEEIDEHGFRNGDMQSVDIVALGDSHTYGFNVSADKSWPRYLGLKLGKNVYNFGVGGYGILQYKYLLNKSIDMQPDAIILGLYLPNDLSDVCRLATDTQYWTSRAAELQININLCLKASNERIGPSRVSTKSSVVRIKEWLQENSAFVSIISEYYVRYSLQYKIEHGQIENGLSIYSDKVKTVILNKRIRAHQGQMDMGKPTINMAFEVLSQFLVEVKEVTEAHKIQFGVLFIPSKERVFYKYLSASHYNLPTEYLDLVENEEMLKNRISSMLDNLQI